jgi:hypothetical protein
MWLTTVLNAQIDAYMAGPSAAALSLVRAHTGSGLSGHSFPVVR